MNDFVDELKKMRGEQRTKRITHFWRNHSTYEAPLYVVGFKGEAEASVMLYLYEMANGSPFRCSTEKEIELRVKVITIAQSTGLNESTVSLAIDALEVAGYIRVQRSMTKPEHRKILQETKQTDFGLIKRRANKGRTSVTVYLLLHPETHEPLRSYPKQYGICFTNGFDSYITTPKETRETLKQMSRAGRAVYITALAIASERVSMEVGMTRVQFKQKSLLGKNAFNRGLRECKRNHLFSFERGRLMLHDPRTGKPSVREKREFVHHKNPKWKTLDFATVTPEQWQYAIQKLLKRDFAVAGDGWTSARRQRCPFCTTDHALSLNFITAKFKCHGKCEPSGLGLAQFIQRKLRTRKMEDAKRYIVDRIAEMTQKQEPVTAQPSASLAA